VGTAEGFGYDFTFLAAFGVFAALLVGVLLYTRLLWRQLHALLRHIVLLPMVSAFNRLPGSVTVLFGPFLSSLRPSRQAIRTLRRQQLSAVAARYADCQKELEAELREGSLVKELESALGVAMREALRRERSGQFYASDYAHLLVPDWTWVLTLASGLVWDDVAANSGVKPDRWWDLTLAGAARTCLSTLEHVWAARSVGDAAAEKPREDKKEEKPDDEKGGTATGASSAPVSAAALAVHPKQSVREWIQAAEDFVAIEIVNYVSQYFVQLRNLVTFLTVGALLLLLAVVSYPFQPQRLILLIMGALILVLAGGAFGIFLQIEKDELTSRVLKTTPNRLSFHPTFLASVATYVLPLLGVLALASSDLSDLMHTLLDPLYKLIK